MNLDIVDELRYQLERALEQVAPLEAGEQPDYFISAEEVLTAHFLIADFFYRSGEGIGGVGPRDINLLISTVDRQRVALGSQWKWHTPYEMAATLLFGLVRNHPFYDANKRTGIVSCANLLLRQKISLTLAEDQMVRFTEDVASHELEKYPSYREILRSGEESPEIVFIAKYLRKYSRSMTNSHHSITFRELITTLKKYGYDLTDPKGNSIDVVYIGNATKETTKTHSHVVGDRVCNMGFPGYSKQVTKGDLKRVRTALGLLPEYGVDSDAFFEGADPLTNLISSYEGALRKLAFR